MPSKDRISMSVIRRLPRYYRFLTMLMNEGVTRISSSQLSKMMGSTASQIRQDLNCFGGFGQQGYGYNIEQLREEIGKILELDSHKPTILVGAGNLGSAIATQIDFGQNGFDLVGIFDRKDSIVGTKINDLTVLHTVDLHTFCVQHKPKVAVLCIPAAEAKEIVEELVFDGVQGFWNYSHYDISLDYPSVAVENVHLRDSLLTLSYKLK